ncbi:MAG: hypothetical protein P1V20_03870 [Verrucomicrobiales bacterium]|nr:hypothetical protein [Verrucomicrobiales bacterium]
MQQGTVPDSTGYNRAVTLNTKRPHWQSQGGRPVLNRKRFTLADYLQQLTGSQPVLLQQQEVPAAATATRAIARMIFFILVDGNVTFFKKGSKILTSGHVYRAIFFFLQTKNFHCLRKTKQIRGFAFSNGALYRYWR